MKIHKNSLYLTALLMSLLVSISFIALWLHTPSIEWSASGFNASSRVLNSFFAALLTSMALVITLTANLYSPLLATIFVKHPITVAGISFIIWCDLFIVACQIITPTFPYYTYIVLASFIFTGIAICFMMPFLYYISLFIRPSYFVPLLEKIIIKGLNKIQSAETGFEEVEQYFETIEVIANIASMATKRDDKKLIAIVLDSLNNILSVLISLGVESPKSKWRKKAPHFPHGMSEEAKFFLKKSKNWPESYLLTKILRTVLALDESQNDIVPLACNNLLETLDQCNDNNLTELVEFHLMVLNSLLLHSLEKKNEERLNSLLYNYRLAIELLIENEKIMNYAVKNYIYYAQKSISIGFITSKKNIFYDLGRIINFMSFESEEKSYKFFKKYAATFWKKTMQDHEEDEDVAWTSLVKAYWSLLSQNCYRLTDIIVTEFLFDKQKHLETIRELLDTESPLEREFSYRLMRSDTLTGMPRQMAEDFYNHWSEKVTHKS